MTWEGVQDRRTSPLATDGTIARVVDGAPRLLRPFPGLRSMDDRVVGLAQDVLSTPVQRNALAQRFHDSICVIADPLGPVPGPRESIQMLNTMESMSVVRGMDDEQRTRFAEGMAKRVQEARHDG